MKIAQITDLHLDDFLADFHEIDARSNFLSVLNDVRERGIEDLILTGDLGVPASLSWIFDTVASYRMNPLVVLGNHDKAEDLEALPFLSAYWKDKSLYYTQVLNGYLCIYLDSSAGPIGPEQTEWLEDQLTSPTEEVLIFVHHPIFDCGQTTMDRLYPLENREALQRLFVQASCNLTLFCGHYHTTHTQTVGDITQYVTPSTLLQLKKFSEKLELESKLAGFRVIELTSGGVTTETVQIH